MRIDRRQFTIAAAAAAVLPRPAAAARSFTDSAGRSVVVPDQVGRVFAAGGPAAVALYVMRPDAMIGWPRALRSEEKPYVLPAVRESAGGGHAHRTRRYRKRRDGAEDQAGSDR